MTLLEIKTAVASYFGKTTADLTVNGQDLFLQAANQVRKLAELQHDFEFQRKLVTLTVNGITGGSLLSAVIQGTATTVDIKSIIEMGIFDNDGNLRPVGWTTVEEGLRNQTSRTPIPRYPTDAQAISPWSGQMSQFRLTGDTVYAWPRAESSAESFSMGFEAYVFSSDWTGFGMTVTGTLNPALTGTYNYVGMLDGKAFYVLSTGLSYIWWSLEDSVWVLSALVDRSGTPTNRWDLSSTSESPAGAYTARGANTGTATVAAATGGVPDVWTTKGQQFIQWGTIYQLNHLYKEFVFRQEGNIADRSPRDIRDEGFEVLKTWDTFRYEQFRRRG